jgi:hypothetical protein
MKKLVVIPNQASHDEGEYPCRLLSSQGPHLDDEELRGQTFLHLASHHLQTGFAEDAFVCFGGAAGRKMSGR